MKTTLTMLATATLLIGAAAAAAEAPQFSDVDANKDGYVSREEATKTPEIMKLFATVDANHDNKLSPTEYQNAVQQLQG